MLDIFELAVKDKYRPGHDYFAGHSLGGHLAFGLAQRMEQQGKASRGLLILDTVPDMRVELKEAQQLNEEELKLLTLVMGMGHLVGMTPEHFKEMKYEEAKVNILQKAREDNAVREFMDDKYLDKYLTIQLHHLTLSQMMKLDATPIGTPIKVFQTQFHADEFMKRFNEWQLLAKQPVVIIPVEGNHVTMLRKPHVEKLGEKVLEVIGS